MSCYSAFTNGKKYDPKEEIFKQQRFSIPIESALYPIGFSPEQTEEVKDYIKHKSEESSEFRLRTPFNKTDYISSMEGVNLSYREGEPENFKSLMSFLKSKQLSLHPFYISSSLIAVYSLTEEQDSDSEKNLSFGLSRSLRNLIQPELRNLLGVHVDIQTMRNYKIDQEMTLLEYAFQLKDNLEKERKNYLYYFIKLSQMELEKGLFINSPDNQFYDLFITNTGKYEQPTEYTLNSNSLSKKVNLRNSFYTHNSVGDSHTPLVAYLSSSNKMTFSVVGLKDRKNKEIAENIVNRGIEILEKGSYYSNVKIKDIIKSLNSNII
eukprot:CAMPEP_0170529168 /NCGR_PEP_ID=MMETSP0209-20121228/17570_1 /TAXON_ID=665100 ORGANISM="Litonotus pictus, Strain P1" /NCGR_SAMPLE_ID=MMETSP0209 /ASSEMBLY_ACC=CAM_ASM_000301 /LENGTH=321 /DNA_ID=CAMNT_0010820813 /DNA_START=432 /DNA_END=1397 /DNA_ORIENTATION=+